MEASTLSFLGKAALRRVLGFQLVAMATAVLAVFLSLYPSRVNLVVDLHSVQYFILNMRASPFLIPALLLLAAVSCLAYLAKTYRWWTPAVASTIQGWCGRDKFSKAQRSSRDLRELCQSHSISVDSDSEMWISSLTTARRNGGFWKKLRRSVSIGSATELRKRNMLRTKPWAAMEGIFEPWAKQLTRSKVKMQISYRLTKLGQRMVCGTGSPSLLSPSTRSLLRSSSSLQERRLNSPSFICHSYAYLPCYAVDALGHDVVDDDMHEVKEVCTDLNLLQFGNILGEQSATAELAERGAAGPLGSSPACLYGAPDKCEYYSQDWEPVMEERKPGLLCWAWRRHLRKGLFVYKTRAVYEGATPVQVRAFLFDDTARVDWDENVLTLHPIPPAASEVSAAEPQPGTHRHSAIMYARSKFPGPVSDRDYVYGRRVWHRPTDGGCYVVNRSCAHASMPPVHKVVRVEDYASGFVVQDAPPGLNARYPAVEVITVYFEDSRIRPLLVNAGVRKGLWPVNMKQEAAFRNWVVSNPQKWQPAAAAIARQREKPSAPQQPIGCQSASAPTRVSEITEVLDDEVAVERKKVASFVSTTAKQQDMVEVAVARALRTVLEQLTNYAWLPAKATYLALTLLVTTAAAGAASVWRIACRTTSVGFWAASIACRTLPTAITSARVWLVTRQKDSSADRSNVTNKPLVSFPVACFGSHPIHSEDHDTDHETDSKLPVQHTTSWSCRQRMKNRVKVWALKVAGLGLMGHMLARPSSAPAVQRGNSTTPLPRSGSTRMSSRVSRGQSGGSRHRPRNSNSLSPPTRPTHDFESYSVEGSNNVWCWL